MRSSSSGKHILECAGTIPVRGRPKEQRTAAGEEQEEEEHRNRGRERSEISFYSCLFWGFFFFNYWLSFVSLSSFHCQMVNSGAFFFIYSLFLYFCFSPLFYIIRGSISHFSSSLQAYPLLIKPGGVGRTKHSSPGASCSAEYFAPSGEHCRGLWRGEQSRAGSAEIMALFSVSTHILIDRYLILDRHSQSG